MRPDLLQAFQIITEFRVNSVRKNLAVLAIYDILLSVQEPSGDFVLEGVLHDRDYTFEFVGVEVTSTG